MFIDFLLPSPCIICNKIGKPICLNCLAELKLEGREHSIYDIPGIYFTEYSDNSAKVINGIKEFGYTALINPIAEVMAQTFSEHYTAVELVPIPSSKANLMKRGFEHTSLFATGLARQVSEVTVRLGLESAKPRQDQSQLTLAEREANLEGAFRLRGPISSNRPIVLFDDVLTSGASIKEANQTFESIGVKPLGFCVFALAGLKKPR